MNRSPTMEHFWILFNIPAHDTRLTATTLSFLLIMSRYFFDLSYAKAPNWRVKRKPEAETCSETWNARWNFEFTWTAHRETQQLHGFRSRHRARFGVLPALPSTVLRIVLPPRRSHHNIGVRPVFPPSVVLVLRCQ